MGILNTLKNARNDKEIRLDIVTLRNRATSLLTSDKKLSGAAKKEAAEHGIKDHVYNIILNRLVHDTEEKNVINTLQNNIDNIESICIRDVQNFYNNAIITVAKLRSTKSVRQLALRYGSYTAESWLLQMNPGGEEVVYNRDHSTYVIKNATTFPHELFKAKKSKEQIIDYFNKVNIWIGNDRELVLNYMDLVDENYKSIIDIIKERDTTEKYQGIYNQVLSILYRGKSKHSAKINVYDTHLASVHRSVDESFVKLALNYDSEAVKGKFGDRKVNVIRDNKWQERVNNDFIHLENTLDKILSSADKLKEVVISNIIAGEDIAEKQAEFEFKSKAAQRLLLSLEREQVVQTCGLTLKEIISIGYRSLDDKSKFFSYENKNKYLMNFIENLYIAKRGYNIDNNGLDEWKTHAAEEDESKCISGCINQFAQGLVDHNDVNIRLINVETMQYPIRSKFPIILRNLARDNKNEINIWLQREIIPSKLLSNIISALIKDTEFSDEFTEEEINRIGSQVIKKIDIRRLYLELKAAYPEEFEGNIDIDEEHLIHSFVFDKGNTQREGKGYIPYLEKLYEIDKDKAKEIIKNKLSIAFEIKNINSELARKGRSFLNLLASSQDIEFCSAISDEFAGYYNFFSYEEQGRLLLQFARENYIAVVEKFIDYIPSVVINTRDISGQTTLHLAVARGNLELVEKLITRLSSEEINAKNTYDGRTALHIAVEQGNVELVEKLITKLSTKSISTKDTYDQTVLYKAVEKGNDIIVEKIISRLFSKNINAINTHDGKTALHLAAERGNDSIVKKIVARLSPKEVNVRNAYDGKTALHYAIYSSHKRVVEILVDKMSKDSINAQDIFGNSALHVAAEFCSDDVVKKIITKMSVEVINAKNTNGKTALSIAAEFKKENVLQMIKHKLVHSELLLKAVRKGKKINAIKAINLGADINYKGVDGNTSLMVAVADNNRSMVKTILKYKHSKIKFKKQTNLVSAKWVDKIKNRKKEERVR